jgi:membrane dipeptidase
MNGGFVTGPPLACRRAALRGSRAYDTLIPLPRRQRHPVLQQFVRTRIFLDPIEVTAAGSDLLLIDGHNDLPWQLRLRFGNDLDKFDLGDTRALDPPMHTDLGRLRSGGIGAQFWALYVPTDMAGPGASRILLEQLDVTLRLIDRYPGHLALATTADELEAVAATGRIASLLAIEGGHGLENSPAVLRSMARAGVRYMTLTHNAHTEWADCCCEDPRHGGLSNAGKQFIVEMNRSGMLVDLAHASVGTMWDALATSQVPVVFTHSGARAVTDHVRNVPDQVLHRVRDTGGLVMATFVPAFISERVRQYEANLEAEETRLARLHPVGAEHRALELAAWRRDHPAPRATLADVADHIDHLVRVMGVEHVGIGSDFDGITKVPTGLEDVSCFPALLDELRSRGHDMDAVRAIAGGNMLRVLRAAERFAANHG